MRHAYLIIAHGNFKVLDALINALDDARNDFYVHIDRRVDKLPALHAKKSGVTVLEKRIKVIWGDVSQIKAEYLLYEAALSCGGYDYYHLISGVHYPLKSIDDIESFFVNHKGSSVLMDMPCAEDEIRMRFGRYHFFLSHLVDRRIWLNKLYHFCWRGALFLQRPLKPRDCSHIHGKASQWCSLTEDAVKAIISQKPRLLKKFRRTFCCDEFLVRSALEGSGCKMTFDHNLCFIDFVNTTPRIYALKDYDELMSTGALFARKMSDEVSMPLLKKIDECTRM